MATKAIKTVKEKSVIKSKRELAKEQKAEENIISTICGNTTPYQRKVSADWVALASGTRDLEKVKKVANKYGLKVSDNNIDLSGKANMGKAYAAILDKRRKEMEDYLKRREEIKKSKDKALKKTKAQAAKNAKKSKGAKR